MLDCGLMVRVRSCRVRLRTWPALAWITTAVSTSRRQSVITAIIVIAVVYLAFHLSAGYTRHRHARPTASRGKLSLLRHAA